MNHYGFKYIYGPVSSWRLGSSLGIDPLSYRKKICSFDCVYCQLGKTEALTDVRGTFVNVADIIQEIDALPPSVMIDYMTISGAGEPTLAENLGQIIHAIKAIRKERIAVITNSSLLMREDVRKDLMLADTVIAKLDASSQRDLTAINRPYTTITFNAVWNGLQEFKRIYRGRLALQIMFIERNKDRAPKIAERARIINPDEVEINTPLRPCAVAPLSKEDIALIEGRFKGMNVVSVYSAKRKKVDPLSDHDTLMRRGKG